MPNRDRKQAAGVIDVVGDVNMSSGPARQPADPLKAAAKEIFKRAAKGDLNSGLPQRLGFQGALSLLILNAASHRYICTESEGEHCSADHEGQRHYERVVQTWLCEGPALHCGAPNRECGHYKRHGSGISRALAE